MKKIGQKKYSIYQENAKFFSTETPPASCRRDADFLFLSEDLSAFPRRSAKPASKMLQFYRNPFQLPESAEARRDETRIFFFIYTIKTSPPPKIKGIASAWTSVGSVHSCSSTDLASSGRTPISKKLKGKMSEKVIKFKPSNAVILPGWLLLFFKLIVGLTR